MVILKEMTAHDGNRLQRTKSPESIARGYQLEYTDKAKEGNTIVCLETGCGKTLIAVMLLKQLSYLFPSSTPYIAVFLVPTVMLVQQQANVIGELSDLKVGQYNGQNDSGRWDLQKWEDDVHNMEVLVMTPQILLNILRHALIKMEAIKVLIFDECHHCQKGHPYARIMEEYYFKVDICARPRILGMTASPVIRKGKSEFQCSQDIDSLERLLDAKIITLEDRRELEAIVPSPTIEVREYSRVYDSFDRLESLVQTMHNLKPKQGMEQIGKSWERKKAAIDKISRDLEYCIFELGFWFARHAAKDVFCTDEYTLGERIEENGETNPNIDKDVFLRDIYQCLNQIILQGGYEDLEFDTLKPDHVSNKVVSLVNVLLNFRVSQLKCIVFVERVVAAKVLASFLCQLFKSMRCEYIVGSHSRMGHSSRQSMAKTLHDFRSGMVDVLVATNVAEEGLDIQDCCLVIQFDMPKTLRSYIQSRGRARVRASHYVVLKDRTNFLEDQLLETLIQSESFVKQKILSGHDMAVDPEEREEDFDVEMFRVESTGATVNIHYGVQLLHHFCSKLPSDQFYHPQPTFSYISEPNGIKCNILLPSNAPIRRVVGESCESETAAKKAACLKACRILHSKGALTDYLLPQTGMMVGDGDGDVSHHPHNFKETSAELQETIIPAVWLRKTTSRSSVMSLHAYMLSFIAVPDDREYINFALLLQSPLPEKAANICETLQLRHRRAVLCKLQPLRNIFLNQSEVTRAENFQSTLFSLLLDRNPEHSNPTELHMADGGWYLLLPLKSTQDLNTSQEQEIDWNKISKFTSARDSKHAVGMSDSVCASSSGASLQFANGNVDMEEVPGLLVKTIRGKDLYCIINIFTDRSADSPFPNDRYKTYVDYFKIMYNHEILHREQPLLKARFLREAHNFLQDRSSTKKDLSSNNAEEGSAELNKSLVELPPEICSIKFYGLHDDLVNSSVILPSFMHKLESILAATQLHDFFSAQFPEGSLVSVEKVLEAITTKKCMEDFSLERLELLGDSFLKYAVSRHLFLAHDEADEGFLSLQRIQRICNASLFTLGSNHGLPGFIRDGLFDPKHWVAPCHPSKAICDESKLVDLHGESSEIKEGKTFITCNKRHRWMQKKTVADVVEALIGAYLEDGGKQAALAFMKFIGVEISVDFLQISKIQYTSQNNLSLTTRIDSDALEKLLSYKFRHKGLLIEAFTHASFINHFGRCYQRLEFLGDSVLDYIITHYLYREYNESKPGQLTDMRSAIVSNESFARITVEHKLYVQLIYNSVELSRCINEFVCYICTSSENELLGDWDGDKCPKVLGDILESLAGAVFVDGGFDPDLVWKVFEPILQPVISRRNSQLHPVRELQELCQKNHFACTKDLSHNEGCTRCQFTIETLINNEVVLGAATAKDNKSAKRQAALDTLAKLKALGYVHPCKREAIGIEKRRDTDTMLVKEPSKVSKPRKIFWNPNTSMPHGPANLNSSHSVGISTHSKHEQERDAGVSNYQHIKNKGYEDSGKEPASHSSEIKGGQTSAPSASSLGTPNAESKVKLGSVSQQSKMSPQDSVLQQRETGELVNDTSLHYGDGSFLTEAKLIEKLCYTHLTSSGDSSSNKIDPADRRQNAGTFDKLVQAASKRHFLTHDLPTPREVHPHHPSMPLGDAFNNPDRMEGDDKQEPRKHGWFSCSTAFETGNRGPGSVLSGTPSHITSEYYLGQARADLHEACSRNRWKDPSFICSHEDGPPHDKRYTYDVILQLPSVGQVECTGDPRKNKKAAMESAAAELLSWLGSQGYM